MFYRVSKAERNSSKIRSSLKGLEIKVKTFHVVGVSELPQMELTTLVKLELEVLVLVRSGSARHASLYFVCLCPCCSPGPGEPASPDLPYKAASCKALFTATTEGELTGRSCQPLPPAYYFHNSLPSLNLWPWQTATITQHAAAVFTAEQRHDRVRMSALYIAGHLGKTPGPRLIEQVTATFSSAARSSAVLRPGGTSEAATLL
ncbi:hypothetical protein Bbelb_440950 [Branchiostoma belcheri]|nr:hypothetical protein Bbelb_440950 [Branchiostoma belcheri]